MSQFAPILVWRKRGAGVMLFVTFHYVYINWRVHHLARADHDFTATVIKTNGRDVLMRGTGRESSPYMVGVVWEKHLSSFEESLNSLVTRPRQ